MVDVEISIVCTNNRAALEQCLAALPRACEDLAWRATVVDNGGEDGTSEMVRREHPWADVIRNERRAGFSANHNLTLRRVVRDRTARRVLVLNDDTIFDAGAVGVMMREMDGRPRLGAIGPRLRGLDGVPQQSLFSFPTFADLALHALIPHRPPRKPTGGGWLNGSCILFDVGALAEVGVLDDRFFIFFEDTDIALRLRDAGWQTAISESAGMVHLEHQTVSAPALNSVMARQMLRSQWLYVEKHRGRARASAVVVAVRCILLLRSLRSLARGRLRRDPAMRERGQHLLGLARYEVRVPLAHERRT